MESKYPNHRRDRNPIAYRKHREEVLWQITLPILIGALILLVFALLTIRMEAGETSRWADISLIWLITPAMVIILISLVMLVASIYATVKLIQVLPFYTFQLLRGLIQAGSYVRMLGDRVVEPMLRASSLAASLKTMKRQITRR
jgi:hypothetical protein